MNEFRSLVNFASDAALAIGSNSQIIAWNQRAENLLGYTREQALGQTCYDILQATLPSGERLCTPECEGHRCLEFNTPFAVADCCLHHKDGQWLRASISTLVAPELDQDDVDSSALAVIFLHPIERPAFGVSAGRQLRIFTFGRFALSVADRGLSIERWYRKHALTLLKLLVSHRHEAVHREQVIEYLWSDADARRGRERLKVTTHFLRQQIRDAGVRGDVIAVTNATYALRYDAIWLDCEIFESLFNEGRLLDRRGRSREALVCFEQAERLYKGDFLPEERYADWCAEERERLREIYFDVLGHMVDGYLCGGDHELAAQVCRSALAREPCREGFHRALMTCLARLGHRDRVIAQYQRCRQVLKTELGVEPAPETERLYRDLIVSSPSGKTSIRT